MRSHVNIARDGCGISPRAAGRRPGVRGIALRLFLGYVAAEPDSGLAINPALGLELPTPIVQPVPVVSNDDLATLLRTMGGGSFVDRRDTVIVRLLLDTGMRRAELVGINTDDLEMRHQEVLIHGKGGKARIVPFGNKAALALRKYLRARQLRPAAASPPLLLSTVRRAAALSTRRDAFLPAALDELYRN